MASTLAHELNQPLAAIVNYSAGCLRAIDGDLPRGEVTDALSKLHAQALRAGQIIRKIHDFIRKREPVLARCEIDGLIRGIVDFFGAEVRRRRIFLTVDLPDAPLIARADRLLVEQVVLNLLRNGTEAMVQNEPDRRRLRISAAESDGMVEIAVADRGRGINTEAAERLFEPFFTTKNEGMGIGLNICRSIVEFHGGRLWHEDNPEGGTIFRFTLPASVAA
jgi:two-component system sensor histidine kinase DctS